MPAITTMPQAKDAKPTPAKLEGKPKKKAASAAAPTEEVQKAPKGRPVIYPEVRAEVCHGANAITEADADTILDWVPESEFQRRKQKEQPGTEANAWTYGDVYMLRDASTTTDKGVPNGEKVRCLNNLDNRPFDERWSLGLTQTILKFQWAGTITISDVIQQVYGQPDVGMQPWTAPDGKTYQIGDLIEMSAGTINGSSIGLSRTGRVESGQHSLCALKRACQMYRNAPKGTYPEWDEYLSKHADRHNFGKYAPGPVIETILVTGLSEDRRVLMTVDNCKQRTEADVFYTSDIFVKLRGNPGKRQEMSRMMAACVDLFWKRTDRKGYKTHSEVMQMVVDHPKLIKAVEHLFTENSEALRNDDGKVIGGNLISHLGLSAGQAACLCYLMGCSASDGDEYRNGKPAPKEKKLDWSRWDKSKEFWAMIGSHEGMEPLRRALLTKIISGGDVGEDGIELSGGLAQRSKLCLLAKAWKTFAEERTRFTELDLQEGGCLHLRYSPASSKTVKQADGSDKVIESQAELLEDPADFGGIDVPQRGDTDGETKPKTKEELEREKEEIRKRRFEEQNEKIRQMRLSQNAVPVVMPGSKGKPALKGGV